VKDLRPAKGFYVDAFGCKAIFESKEINVKFLLIEDNNGNVIQIFQARKSQPKAERARNQ
jgi:hypothetical protein